jgi:PAS domain S-box-containing protein
MVNTQLLVAAYVVAALLPLAFVPSILAGRDSAGATGLLVVVAATVLYASGSTIGVAGQSDAHWFVGINLIILAASVGPVGYLLIAGEYTETFAVRPVTVGVLALEPIVTQVLVWTNDAHHLIYSQGTNFGSFESVATSYRALFWVHTAVAYGVLLGGCVLFAREFLRSHGVRREQSFTLTVAAVPPGVAAAISTFGDIAFNPTPFGLIVMVGIVSWALFRGQFLDVVPVARRTAMAEIDDAMVTLDKDDRVVDANRAAHALFGTSRDDVGASAGEFLRVLPEDVRKRLTTAVDVETQFSAQLDGDQRHFSVAVSPVGEDGTKGRVVLFRDITAQKRRELQLEGYGSLFEKTSDCVVEAEYVDDEPVVRGVNAAFEDVFGYEESELLGRPLDDIIVPEEYREEAAQINQLERQNEDVRREVTRLTADGERDFLLRTVHHQDALSYAVYTDITERKERERELRRQNERLDRFASVASHDLRNPLNAAQLQFDLIRDQAPAEPAAAVQQNLDRMERMIDELLTLARSGQTVETTDAVGLRETATDAWQHVESGDASLELTVAADVHIQADSDRLLHIFENLFRNAVEHNDGSLTVRVGTTEQTQGADGEASTGFFVEDNGDGIPEQMRSEIFEHGYTTNDEGTGFGLSIVEEIVDAHGWTIQATESQAGGARFEITGVTLAEEQTGWL